MIAELEAYLLDCYRDDRIDQGLFMKLVEEIGEVAEVLNKKAGRKQSGSEDLQTQLGNELADVIHYAVAIAALNGLDINEIITLSGQGHTRLNHRLLTAGGVNVSRRTSSTPPSVALPAAKIRRLRSKGVLHLRFAILQGTGTRRTGVRQVTVTTQNRKSVVQNRVSPCPLRVNLALASVLTRLDRTWPSVHIIPQILWGRNLNFMRFSYNFLSKGLYLLRSMAPICSIRGRTAS